MNGKIIAIVLGLSTVGAGVGMWYAQQYGYYDRIPADSPAATLSVETATGRQPLATSGFEGIDATSSPLRWRACANVARMPDDPVPYADPTPLIAPGWFNCFDAVGIGADLESGAAMAVLGQSDIRPDVDRVFAVYPDGRIVGWHQYNEKNPERGVMD